MEASHRTLLRKNRMAFVEDLILDEVAQMLVEENILNDRMVEVIYSKQCSFDRNVAFLNRLPTRGPRAFRLFYLALSRTGQDHLAEILCPGLPPEEENDQPLGNITRLPSSPNCPASSFSFAESTPSKNSDTSFNSSFEVGAITQVTPNRYDLQKTTPEVLQYTPTSNVVNRSPLSANVPGSNRQPTNPKVLQSTVASTIVSRSPPSANVPGDSNTARTPVEQMDVTVSDDDLLGQKSMLRFTDFEALRSTSSFETLKSAAYLIPTDYTASTSNHIQVVNNDNHTFLKPSPTTLPNLACDAPNFENVQVKPATVQFLQAHLQDCYPLFSNPKGIALLVNVTEFEPSSCLDDRLGGDIDCARLELMFHQLSFDVYKLINGTATEISNTLKNFAVWAKLKEYESCFVVLMSHGEDGVIFGSDGRRINLNEMYILFSNKNCPHLQNKPKVFLIQACRGDQPDKGTDQIDTPHCSDSKARRRKHLNFDEPDSKNKLPTSCDCLYAYATVPGFTAMRNTEKGSWFIQAFIQIVAFHARDKSLYDIMTMTNNQVKCREGWSPNTEFHRCKEMSEFTSTLCKPFYFFPGLYLKRVSDM